MYEDEDVGGD
jgi:hypothetical protein